MVARTQSIRWIHRRGGLAREPIKFSSADAENQLDSPLLRPGVDTDHFYSSARADSPLDSPPRRPGVGTGQMYSSARTDNQLDSPPLRPSN